jgi:hypothetical protein
LGRAAGEGVSTAFGGGGVLAALGRGGEVLFFIGIAGLKVSSVEPAAARAEPWMGRCSNNGAASNLTLPAVNFVEQGRSQKSGPFEGR